MAECQFCKEKVGANDFLLSEGTVCSACGNRSPSPPSEPCWVSAAPLEPVQTKAVPPNLPPRTWWTPPAAPEPTVQAEPNKPKIVPAILPPPPPPPKIVPGPSPSFGRNLSADNDDEPPSLLERLRNLDFGSALAFLCFSEALLFVTFAALEPFIKPIAALGLLAGALPALWRRRNAVLPLFLSSLCLVVLLFAGKWPSFSSPPPRLVTVSLTQPGMAAHQAAGEDDWVDASAKAVKFGDVRVQIVSAQIGPVNLKPSSSTERYLSIHVRVSYEGIIAQQTPYEPWSDRADSPSKHPPTLTDNQGRNYTQKTFDPGWKVAGRADLDALNPGHQVKDVLVYPVPAKGVEHLRLMLPASAFGRTGAFRFQIPRSMIRGL